MSNDEIEVREPTRSRDQVPERPAGLVAPRPPDLRGAHRVLHRPALRAARPRGCSSALLSLLFDDDDRVEELFPFVLVTLVGPAGARDRRRRSRRFGTYMWIGIVDHRARRGRRRVRWCSTCWSMASPDARRPDRRVSAPSCPWSSTSRAAARKPPRHLADLDARRAQARWPPSSGCPASAPSSSRPTTSPGSSTTPTQMTDLPAAAARRAGRGAAADADDAAAHPRGRPRHHPQDALEAVRRRAGRVGADALPGPGHDVRLHPGRLRHGLPVLRHRAGRAAAQHVDRRDRRAGRRRRPRAGSRRGARRAGPGLQRRVHGHGRADGQLQGGHRRRTPAHRPGARRARACPRAASRSPPSGWCRGCASSPTRASRSRSRSSLHAPDDELRNELVPINTRFSVAETVEAAWHYAGAPSAGSRSSTP